MPLISCMQNGTPKPIQRDKAVISYQVAGNGDTALVFVHGSYIDQTYWKHQVGYFSSDYKVVTLDLPGHGKSGKERTDWSVNGFAEDVVAVIKELDLKKVILIGHSLGAAVNLIAATSYPKPVVGFIAIDFFKNAGMPLPGEYQKQAITLQENLVADFANTNEKYARMALLTGKTPANITNRVVKAYRNAYQPMAIETTPEIFEMFRREQKLLPQLQHKLYLVNVDYLPTSEAALEKYAIHGHELLHMKGTCHYPMLENPETLNKLLQKAVHNIANDNKHTN